MIIRVTFNYCIKKLRQKKKKIERMSEEQNFSFGIEDDRRRRWRSVTETRKRERERIEEKTLRHVLFYDQPAKHNSTVQL